jgi:hypothetical protein
VVGLVLVLGSAAGTAVVVKGLPSVAADADLSQLTIAVVLEALGWAALPLYSWLVYTGFRHTRSVGRYASRLTVLAVVAEVPYDLASSGRPLDWSSQNPVFAVLVALGVLAYLEAIRRRALAGRTLLTVIAVLTASAALLMFNVALRLDLMPCGVLLLVFALVFYFLDGRENTMMLVGGTIGALALVFPAFGFAILHYRNGQEGMRVPAEKMMFYALYPVGLLAVAVGRVLAP